MSADIGQLVPAALLMHELGALETFALKLVQRGWTSDGADNEYAGDDFKSLRSGDVNALLVEDKGYFDRTKLAAEVTKVLRLESRDDRIRVYRVIRDGKTAAEVRPGN